MTSENSLPLTYLKDNKLFYTEAAAKVLTALCLPAYRMAASKGFWPPLGERNCAEMQMLIVSEVGELCEATRKPGLCDKIPALTNEEEEIADIFIRLADYCGGRNIDLGRAVMLKHAYNANRPPKHGKKF